MAAAEGNLDIYADGSCLNNGYPGAAAGVGVWISDDDPRNVSRAVHGPPSNQRAELEALHDALVIALAHGGPTTIVMDSAYAIACVREWGPKNWRRNGWRTTKGEPVKHRDVIEACMAMLERAGTAVTLRRVKGHSGNKGNDAADRLARRGVPT